MAESEEELHIRRAISQWLTAQANRIPGEKSWQADVRLAVLQALSQLNIRFAELREAFDKAHKVRRDRPLLHFYMKGGNAFKVAKGEALTSGGDSDWDTQVVFDAWAPPPLLDVVHARVEDIVRDELGKAGVRIAEVIDKANAAAGNDMDDGGEDPDGEDPQTAFGKIAADWRRVAATLLPGIDLSNYVLTVDQPQTLRRVFDHDRLGLWFESAAPLASRRKDATSWVPGQLFNDAVRPFILYRMGYTWRASLKEDADFSLAAAPITKPILMELIDITIPRRNTVEAVEVWDAIGNQHMTIADKNVGFQRHAIWLPFPSLLYHLSEQLDMLCEIADGSSRHADKMARRFARLREIVHSRRLSDETILEMVSERAGVERISQLNALGPITIDQRLHALLGKLPNDDRQEFELTMGEGRYRTDPADPAIRLAVLMMVEIIETTKALNADCDAGALTETAQQRLRNGRELPFLAQLHQEDGVRAMAFSDDLALVGALEGIGYLDLGQVGGCGIDVAAVYRVSDEKALRAIASKLPVLGFLGQLYRTSRENGYSYEYACVGVLAGKPMIMLTLTTASEQELYFPKSGAQRVAPLVEIVRQRKMAASLVRGYATRTALARQYEAGKECIAVI